MGGRYAPYKMAARVEPLPTPSTAASTATIPRLKCFDCGYLYLYCLNVEPGVKKCGFIYYCSRCFKKHIRIVDQAKALDMDDAKQAEEITDINNWFCVLRDFRTLDCTLCGDDAVDKPINRVEIPGRGSATKCQQYLRFEEIVICRACFSAGLVLESDKLVEVVQEIINDM